MKSNLLANLTVSLVAGFGLIWGGLQLEKLIVSVDKTTVDTQVTSAYVKRVGSSKSSKDIYLVTLTNGKVVEVTDLWSLGQVESARLFGQFQSVAGSKDCDVTVTYGGFDNPWLSMHPMVIESETDLTCESNEPKN